MHFLERIYRIQKHYGVLQAATITAQVLLGRMDKIRLNGLKSTFSLRRNSSDLAVFDEVFLRRLYQFKVSEKPKVIVDVGANIGLASLFWASQYPEARILALEPFPPNFALLQTNTESYANIECVEAALWRTDGLVEIQGSAEKAWGAEVSEASDEGPSGTRAISVPTLLTRWDLGVIDILKIDIEGSEKEVFSVSPDTWLRSVRVLAIEIHDRKKTGCSKAVFSALSRANFSCRIRGDNLICRNLDID